MITRRRLAGPSRRLQRGRAVASLALAVALPAFFAAGQPPASGANICAWDFLRPSLGEGSAVCNGAPCLSALEVERTLVDNLDFVCRQLRVEDLPTGLADDCVLTASSGALVCGAGGGAASLTVREEDGSPSVAAVTEIRVSDGTLADQGGGAVSVTTGGGGGGGAPAAAQYLTLATDGTLTGERRAVAGSGLTATDGGTGGDWTLAVDLAVVEGEDHAAEHHQGAADPLAADALASACGAGAPLEGDGAGGVQCGTDDAGTDDQTAAEVAIADAGGLYAAADVEAALQESPPGARTPTGHAASHAEGAGDELLAEDLATACADGQVLKADPTGGLVCGSAGSASFGTLDSDYGDEVITSAYDLAGARLEVPNSTAPPAADCDAAPEAGRVHVDTDAPTGQQLYVCEGAGGWVLSSGGGGGGGAPDLLYVRHEEANGVNGGDGAGTNWNTRPLNTVLNNTIAGASLASNRITLPAGSYRIRARAPACRMDRHRIRLRNVDAGTTLLLGSSQYADAGADGDCTDGTLWGRFSLAAETDLEIQHYITNSVASSGGDFGFAASTGDVEIYAEVWVEVE